MSVTNAGRTRDPGYATEIPDEVGIQLTNKCNLRCKHCFQWNEEGFFHSFDKETQCGDIDIELVEKIFNETRDVKSNLYLWGGEPLCYKWWDQLSEMLVKDPRWSVLCTNATLIDKKIDSIIKISGSLAVLLSLDGFEEENDSVRGKGTFKKVAENIDLLLNLKKKGIFKGEVSVNCVISEAMAGKMYDFMEYFEAKGVNTVYFCFPWYISQSTSEKMDRYFKENFNWLYELKSSHIPSWHSYKYCLNPDIVPVIKKQMEKINQRVWKIRIRFQPALEIDEVEGFIKDDENTAQNRKRCLALSNRMNVQPSGEVTVCKLFPEFTVGSLKNEGVKELWHNEKFKRCRETIGCGLMPVCSKCVLLYLHGI
jgi:MoaA/NifB/PqqE/SkfB family radical SAM enzyme